MTATAQDIREYCRGFLATREQMETLAVMAGYDAAHVGDIEYRDLQALVATARKRPESAYQVAARIAQKMGHKAREGVPAPSPSPSPFPGPHGPEMGPSVDALRADLLAKVETTLQAQGDASTLALLNALADYRATTDAAIPGMVAEALKALMPTRVEVVTPDAPPVPLGVVHYQTARILRYLGAGQNVYLHGPAGSGKTTVARKCAEAFGLPLYVAAKVESEYLLLGFRDARGEVVRTPFREAYEHGGMFLFDELDGSSPGAVVALNMALANGHCPFPDALVTRHPDFKCIAAGNTALTGGNRQYTGRQALDAASVDRFAFVEFPYDERLEHAIAPNKAWCNHVQAIRAIVNERGLDLLVTPRATLAGAALIAAGDTWAEAEEATIFKGLDADTVDQIKRALPPVDILAGNEREAA